MLTVNQVTYQNFLAAGNAPITVRLDQHPASLVVGTNGVGKSTVFDAVCFAMFGKPLRDVNKPALLNWVNERDCLVVLDITTLTGTYQIKRGIKPNVFEIYHNGTLIPAPADSKDYQTILETTILKLNAKAFGQVVVLGNASYVPFMKLPTGARRGIIEDLLDIEVFTSMNALAKEDLTELKSGIDANGAKLRLVAEKVRMAESFAKQVQTQNQQLIESINDAMVKQSKEIGALLDERKTYEDELKTYEAPKSELHKAQDMLMQSEKVQRTLNGQLQLSKSERVTKRNAAQSVAQSKQADLKRKEQFWDNDKCPQCEQAIAHDHKASKKQYFAAQYDEVALALGEQNEAIDRHHNDHEALIIVKLTKLKDIAAHYTAQVETLQAQVDQCDEVQTDINRIDAQLPMMRRRLIELETQYKDACKPPVKTPEVDVPALEADLLALQTESSDLSGQKVVIDAATLLLKDNGIKTRVVKHYLPIINKQINFYLTAMNFPIQFEFDESFTEHINSRYRSKVCTYNSFSEGEKKRIDLALLLTWRSIARLKNSAAVSLLVLDEVMDGSLDAAGIDDMLRLLAGLEPGVNVYVISHRDQNFDKFNQVLTFTMRKGFSELA
jgi:hypothetical protein